MKMLACADMGKPTCTFVAKAETDEEVMDMMMEHMKTAHPDDMNKMGMDEMKSMMMSKMQTV